MNTLKTSPATITRRTIAAATLVFCTALSSLPALGVNQNTVLAELETAPSNWTLPTVRAWVNDFSQGDNHSVSLGDTVDISVDTTSSAHFVLALVDSYGEVKLIRPSGPASKANYQFTAEAPVGQYSLFAFATDAQIPGGQIGLPDGKDTNAMDYNMEAVENFVTALTQFSAKNLIAKAPEYQFTVEDSSLALQTRGLVKKVSRLQKNRETTKKNTTNPIVVPAKPVTVAAVKNSITTTAIPNKRIKKPAEVSLAEVQKARTTPAANPGSLSLDIKFQVNSAGLTPSGVNSLDSLGSALMVMQRTGKLPTLLLEGHTDDSGEADYNLNLSEKRANSAKAYLLERFGLPADAIEAVGFGETTPLQPNSNAAARQLNRRVELKVVR